MTFGHNLKKKNDLTICDSYRPRISSMTFGHNLKNDLTNCDLYRPGLSSKANIKKNCFGLHSETFFHCTIM